MRSIASTLTPSCPHPMGDAVPITLTRSTAEKLAVTGYALRHAPAEPTTPSPHAWLRSFDRNGGKIPAADWRTAISPRLWHEGGLVLFDEMDSGYGHAA